MFGDPQHCDAVHQISTNLAPSAVCPKALCAQNLGDLRGGRRACGLFWGVCRVGDRVRGVQWPGPDRRIEYDRATAGLLAFMLAVA